VVPRGLRFGLRVGSVPATIVVGVWLVGAVVWLVRPPRHNGVAGLGRGLVGVVGSLGMGSLLGVVMGAALAIAPTWLVSRGLLRGLLAALLSSREGYPFWTGPSR
jgi:hypothetical protein